MQHVINIEKIENDNNIDRTETLMLNMKRR